MSLSRIATESKEQFYSKLMEKDRQILDSLKSNILSFHVENSPFEDYIYDDADEDDIFSGLFFPMTEITTYLTEQKLISDRTRTDLNAEFYSSGIVRNNVSKLTSLYEKYGVDGLDDFDIDKWTQFCKDWLITRIPRMFKVGKKANLDLYRL